jgi:hypothetical protein
MKIYYVKWQVRKEQNQLGTSLHHLGSLYSGQPTTTAAKGKYFVSKDKATALAANINEAAKVLEQFESHASVEELEVEE